MEETLRNLGQARARQNPLRRGDQEMTSERELYPDIGMEPTDLGEDDYADEKDLHEDNPLA